jgi:predicted helicase
VTITKLQGTKQLFLLNNQSTALMTALTDILNNFRAASQSEREKGAYFENLVKVYLQTEPVYKDLFNGKVFLWDEWRRYWMSLGHADPQADAGIDLVAVEDTKENPKIFAVQGVVSENGI